MIVYIIADYGAGDMAYGEVSGQILSRLEPDYIVPVNVAPFSSLACGLAVSEIAARANPGDFIYHNVAPRRDDLAERDNNAGEKLSFAKTSNGVFIFGPNSFGSYSLSLDLIDEFYTIDAPDFGSQFRSRDIFPEYIVPALSGDSLIESAPPGPLPEGILLATDGYGNLKTNWKNPPDKDYLQIEINNIEASAFLGDSAFSKKEGYLVLSPGSSRQGFYEIFLRGGSAAEIFDYPESGLDVYFS